MIGEQRIVRSFLRGEPLTRGQFEIELRPSPPTTDPRSGLPLPVPPLSILWVEERPLAVRVRNVVVLSSFPSLPRLATLVDATATASGLAVEQVNEAAVWRTFAQPPRPRLAR